MTVKEARLACGFTQREVCELVDVPLRTLQGWELGERGTRSYTEKLVVDKILKTRRDKVMIEKEVNRIVDNVVASLAMEGLVCTDQDKERAAKVVRGEISESDAIKDIINGYGVREDQP